MIPSIYRMDPLIGQFSNLTLDMRNQKTQSSRKRLAVGSRPKAKITPLGTDVIAAPTDKAAPEIPNRLTATGCSDEAESGTESDWFVKRYIDSLPVRPDNTLTKPVARRGFRWILSKSLTSASLQSDGEDNASGRRKRLVDRLPWSTPLAPPTTKKLRTPDKNLSFTSNKSRELPPLYNAQLHASNSLLGNIFENDEGEDGSAADTIVTNSLHQFIPSPPLALPPLTTGRHTDTSSSLLHFSKTDFLSSVNSDIGQTEAVPLPLIHRNGNQGEPARGLPNVNGEGKTRADSSVLCAVGNCTGGEETVGCLFGLKDSDTIEEDYVTLREEHSAKRPVDDSSKGSFNGKPPAPAATTGKKRVTWSKTLPRRVGYAVCSFHPSEFANSAPRLAQQDTRGSPKQHIKRRQACCLENDPALSLVHLAMTDRKFAKTDWRSKARISVSIFQSMGRK